MALINCPECGKEMSDKATSCPKCGCPSTEWTKKEEVIQKAVEITPIDFIPKTQTESVQSFSVEKPIAATEVPATNIITPNANISILEDITRKFPREQRTLMVRELKNLTGIETSQAINAIDTYLDKGEDILGITKEQLQYQQNLTNPMANMVFCRWCGNKIPDSAMFCQQCGKPIASKPTNEENSTDTQQTEIKEKVNRCKICGTKIESGKTTCNRCKRKINSSDKRVAKTILACLIYVVLVVTGVSQSGNDSNVADKPNDSNNMTESVPAQTIYYTGQVANVNDLDVIMLGYEENYGGNFSEPSAGNMFVIVEFEVTNNGQEEAYIDGSMNFNAYVDGYATDNSFLALTSKNGLNTLSGAISSGKRLKGVVGYEVPQNWSQLEMQFTDNVWTDKNVKFVISK